MNILYNGKVGSFISSRTFIYDCTYCADTGLDPTLTDRYLAEICNLKQAISR